MTRSRPRVGERGFTLVESMVAITLLATGALALGALLLRSSRTAVVAASTAQTTAALSSEVARLNAVPFTLLTVGSTCASVSVPPFPHTRCTTVTSISATVRRVRVVVTPAATTVHPDTVTFDRTQAGGGSPLDTP